MRNPHRHSQLRSILLLVLLLGTARPVLAQFVFEATVIRVSDGDTIQVRAGEKNFRVRLHGIDAPERGQAYGTKATDFLAAGIAGKEVRLLVLDIDNYGRIVAEVFTGQTSWNLELLRAGLAWHYTDYDQSAAYAEAEAEARSERRGLWVETRPIAPWAYRRGER